VRRRLLITSVCSLLFSVTQVSAQPRSSLDTLEELESIQGALDELEARYNINDPRLIETLEQLADAYIELNEFDAAHEALDRATQITRMTAGLFTPQQVPLLQKKIDNYANRGDWERVRTHSEHLLWLYREKIRVSPALVDDLMHLSNVYLRGVVEDLPLQQGYHFRHAMEANRLALLVAETVWGKHDARSLPVIYQLLKQFHLQTVAVNRGGKTGYQLRELMPGSTWISERGLVRRANYFVGISLLNQMREIFSTAEPPDREGMAMVELYAADWQVLFTRREDALASYRSAYQGLIEAGVNRDLINDYLMAPAVLPLDEFYPTVSMAMAERSTIPPLPEVTAEVDSNVALHFDEWSYAFPNVQSPVADDATPQADSNFALFSFNITGLTQITRWMGGRFQSGIGVAEDAEILHSQLQASIPQSGLIEKLHTLRFRPRLLDGEPAEASGTLVYLVANDSY